jgi:type VI secretion system secreted protein VgrG
VHYPFVREEDSFWCRVAQTWAGPGLGTWVNHRIGHEVVIAFEHGDINRPIVMGSLYNGENGIPWADTLGDEVSGWRSQSSAGFNEVLMRDKDGDELLSMIAQLNMTVTVGQDQTEGVGRDQTETVGRNYKKDVTGDSEWTTSGTDYIQSTKRMTLESPTEIVLKCGGSVITMTPSSIQMTTTHFTCNAAQNAALNAGVAFEAAAGKSFTMMSGDTLSAAAKNAMGLETKKLSSSGSEEVVIAAKKYSLASEGDSEFQAGGDFKVKGSKAVQIKGDSKVSVTSDGNTTVKGSKVEMN